MGPGLARPGLLARIHGEAAVLNGVCYGPGPTIRKEEMERPGKGVVITTRHMPTPMADFSYQRGDGRWFNPDGAYLTPPWPEAKVLNVVHSDGWFTVTWVDEDLLPRNK